MREMMKTRELGVFESSLLVLYSYNEYIKISNQLSVHVLVKTFQASSLGMVILLDVLSTLCLGNFTMACHCVNTKGIMLSSGLTLL
jgi:hypothetical protein